MVTIERERLKKIFSGFEGKRIAVIGDLMLDRYFWGKVNRISPEAPVPVMEVEEESTRLGGAANVANNIASLGGLPVMVGVVGDDVLGEQLRSIVAQSGFSPEGIVVDPSRPTTIKTRVIAHGQHIVRIDHERKNDISKEVEGRILGILESNIDSLDGILLEDYNKGVLTADLIENVCKMASKHSKIVTVDPKYHNFFSYQHVTVFKPNRKETEEALGALLKTDEDVKQAGMKLLEKLNASNVLLTLGDRGMMLFEKSGQVSHVPTTARKVADVSGAGDTVIATLTMGLAAGATIKEASMLANHAGGIVCGDVGIVPIERDLLFAKTLEHNGTGGTH